MFGFCLENADTARGAVLEGASSGFLSSICSKMLETDQSLTNKQQCIVFSAW